MSEVESQPLPDSVVALDGTWTPRPRCCSPPGNTHPASPAALHEISTLLDTGLDRRTLSILVQLIELGVNPAALAHVVQEMRRERLRIEQAA